MVGGILGRSRRVLSTLGRRSANLIGGVVRGARRRIDRVVAQRFPEHARSPRPAEPERTAPAAPAVADERTIRRTAEAQDGGISSRASAERYQRGENPGGTHGGLGHQRAPTEPPVSETYEVEDEPGPRIKDRRETRRGS